jgi:hypothetical protein
MSQMQESFASLSETIPTILREYRWHLRGSVRLKADQTVVTDADYKIDQFIRESIRKLDLNAAVLRRIGIGCGLVRLSQGASGGPEASCAVPDLRAGTAHGCSHGGGHARPTSRMSSAVA